ncbi:MAG: ExbD/TolR family protein [Zoogloeaceae bacterium]|jgi:biopolymer transport protein TolR|nr:ExbD/TolR family protein [Zoogloeaceae bacterium]
MRRPPRRLKNEINVVPYIDVMLVLLVIFMVAAPMMNTSSVDLPSVEQAGTPPSDPVRIEVDAAGNLKLSVAGEPGRPIDREELSEYLAQEIEDNPELAVLVAGDKSARYEAVLRALDDIKSSGFTGRVGLETTRR